MTAPRASLLVRAGWLLPALVGLTTAALAFVVFQELVHREDQQIHSSLDAKAEDIRALFEREVEERSAVLAVLAREWESKFFTTRGAFESDVRLVMSRAPGLSSIEWIEHDGRRSWRYPSAGDYRPLELPAWTARESSTHGWAGVVTLPDGTRAFRLVAALMRSGEPDGWLCGVLRSGPFFDALSASLPREHFLTVSSGGTPLYERRLPEVASGWSQTLPLRIPHASSLWLTVRPSSGWLIAQRSALPLALFVAALGLAALLAWAIRLAQLATHRARVLDSEIVAHRRAAEQVRRLNLELEDRVAERTAALARTNDDLKGFAAFLSHELRQPVFALALMAEILRTEHGDSLGEQGRKCVAGVEDAAKRMGELIAAQLSLSAAASVELADDIVDLGSVIRTASDDLKEGLEESSATIAVEDLPVLRGDRRLLHQLVRNLLENSLKYRRPGVPLLIRLCGEQDEEGVELCYEDNGRGFSSEDAKRLFQAFERLESSGDGFGLGMALCRKIVERHGGTIRAIGRPGDGACFVVRLPSRLLAVAEPADDFESPTAA